VGFGKVFRRRYRVRHEGVDASADVNVAIAANVGGKGQRTSVHTHQRATAGDDRIHQTEHDIDRTDARADEDQEEVTDG
jgi:hypothetical protein